MTAGNKDKKKPLILIVDDVTKNIQVVGSTLKDQGYRIAAANNGIKAIEIAQEVEPDLILLDVMMPELDGFETCKRLKSIENTKDIPIIFLTAKVEPEDIIKGFELGAVDYITKPFNLYELKARIKTHIELKVTKDQLIEKNEILKKLSITDGLTGLFNHRYITDTLADEIEEAERYARPLSIEMIDIDDFKKINDTYGHKFGDQVLVKVADAIESSLRKTDKVGRYGGEEFLIIYTQTDAVGAVKTAERIRESVENIDWQDDRVKITISGGVFERKDESVSEMITGADNLLYKAKRNGKNRIEHQ